MSIGVARLTAAKSSALVRQLAALGAWASRFSVVVTVLSAVLLSTILWEISRLDALGGLDPGALSRERIAMRDAADMIAAWEAIARYRRSLVLGQGPSQTRVLRRIADARMRTLKAVFAKHAISRSWDTDGDWPEALKGWRIARTAAPSAGVLTLFTNVYNHFYALLNSVNNNSGLNYDPAATAQNLGQVVFQVAPDEQENVERSTLQARAAVNGGMGLRQRLDLASSLNEIQSNYNLSVYDFPGAVKYLGQLMPARADEFAALIATSKAFTRSGKAYYSLLSEKVLYREAPTLSPSAVDTAAWPAWYSARTLGARSYAALSSLLAERGRVFGRRRLFVYLALAAATVLVVGLMLFMTQFIVFRANRALARARDEAERLATELARQKAEEALSLSEAQFRAVFQGAALGIAVLDRAGKVIDANNVFRSFFGDSIHPALDGHEQELAELLAGERETFEYEQYLRNALGQEVWTDATVSVVHEHDGKPSFAICMFRDKTALKHSERRILHDKTHDPLTSLPNRWLFEDHLRRRFEEATALLDSFFAVLFIDLERFRDVNESLGHAAGDSVLTQVAQRLRSAVDARDIVARLGSDEFAILLHSLGDILHVESVARRILNNLSKLITIQGRSIYLGSSVGIAIGSASYQHAEDVMRDAEIAMQHAKIGGGTRYALFDSTMHARAQKRLQLASDIREALERKEFRLVYQPIVRITDGAPVGCEALLRWDHPTEGVMNPAEFIPIAEQSGLAAPIGRFVISTACEQLYQWRRYHKGRMNFDMHVNVSAAELMDRDFEHVLVDTTVQHGLSPENLTIEITESVVLDSGTRVNVTLERIRDRGFKICIDDFGTGYSSLRYLQQFKVDAIKIDRGFVSGSDGELASEPIVRTLMTLAEAFHVRVVAEGVETVRQREILRNAGCRLAQGFLYSRPIPATELVTLYPDVLGETEPRSATA
ncbi:MAG: GGDEF domain-containing protein [Candidatus Eremiobacteraeota bacterium]|nr:GGDEF domain-containing protein [Candidatus Eremiobacteraeota bacterium]